MTTIKKHIALFALITFSFAGFAQGGTTEGVSIKSSVSPPDPSAMLDVESSSKGLLIPRVALLDINNGTAPVLNPANSLLVYNTNVTVLNGSGTGFYYWNYNTGSTTVGKWIKLGEGSKMAQVTYTVMVDMIPALTTTDLGLMVFCTTNTQILPAGSLVTKPVICNTNVLTNYNVYGVWYLSKVPGCNNIDVLVWKYIDNSPNGKLISVPQPPAALNCTPCNVTPQ